MTNPNAQPDLDFPPVTPEAWRAQAEIDLKGAPFDKKLVTHTYEGITIQPLYTEADWPSASDPSGLPGIDPFTRGATALSTVRGWDIRQEHALPWPADNNKAILQDLSRGATSIRLRFDDASRAGKYDSDETGVGGVAIRTLEDLDEALAGVDLKKTYVGLDAGASFIPASAMLNELWNRRGLKRDEACGAFNANPLGALAETGHLPVSIDTALARMADLAKWTIANRPTVQSVLVGTRPYHHAGATATQDLAFSMATAVAYLRVLTEAGLSVDQACGQMHFSFGVGCNFFLAIAKLRAARRLWARIAETSGATEAARGMRMHVTTSRRVITERDPWVNMLRTTVCAAAGAIGGAQAISAVPFDAAIGQPDDFSRRIARNTQLILQEESHLGRVADPAGGSWYIEKLTDQLAQAAWKLFQEIEARGGMVRSLADGWAASQINHAFAERLKNLQRRRDPITGVSEFPNVAEKPVAKAASNTAEMRKQLQERLVTRRIHGRPEPETPISSPMAAAVEMVKLGWSAIDILGRLKEGTEPTDIEPLRPHPFSEPFEALRTASDEFLEKTGRRPRVFLANMGPVARHTARANYASNFFGAGGFEIISNTGFKTPPEAAEAFKASGAHIAVICSDDKLYAELAADTAAALKAAGARTVVLAGNPGEAKAAYQAAGIDRFIYISCDVLEILRALLHDEGVMQ
ncbi:methylmalonyl-CoA mutase subunit beta [bacterium]|nr:methylmalonyl-CoA mutase subunit beta [bacterium]